MEYINYNKLLDNIKVNESLNKQSIKNIPHTKKKLKSNSNKVKQ